MAFLALSSTFQKIVSNLCNCHSPALALVAALVGRQQVRAAAELCQQDNEVKMTLCLYIRVCNNTNKNLFYLVRDKQGAVDETAYNLRDSLNVTTVDDLYQEMITYGNILRGLDSSMRAHMSTPEYASESSVTSVATLAKNVLQRMSMHFTNIQQTTTYISENIQVAGATSTPVDVSAKKLQQVYTEMNYVTGKMTALLVSWLQKCISC